MYLRVPLIFIFSALLSAPVAAVQENSTHKFPLPNFGQLELSMPKHWKTELRQPPQDLPPTIVLIPPSGNSFQVLITPLWAVRPGVVVPGKTEMRKTISRAADQAMTQSVEKMITVKEITGESGTGYYFSATDKAPKPGEFKYMTQGNLRVGELVLLFTVLTNDGGEGIFNLAMDTLKAAKHFK